VPSARRLVVDDDEDRMRGIGRAGADDEDRIGASPPPPGSSRHAGARSSAHELAADDSARAAASAPSRGPGRAAPRSQQHVSDGTGGGDTGALDDDDDDDDDDDTATCSVRSGVASGRPSPTAPTLNPARVVPAAAQQAPPAQAPRSAPAAAPAALPRLRTEEAAAAADLQPGAAAAALTTTTTTSPPIPDVATGDLLHWRVALVEGACGTVRFVGPTAFAKGEWVGLELELPTGSSDGSVDGRVYFACEANSHAARSARAPGAATALPFGTFVRRHRIARALSHAPPSASPSSPRDARSPGARGGAPTGRADPSGDVFFAAAASSSANAGGASGRRVGGDAPPSHRSLVRVGSSSSTG
jgi:hypothetical protein